MFNWPLRSKAMVLGFHTQIESHADALVKELGVQVKLHDIIYHAIDDVKVIMAGSLIKSPRKMKKEPPKSKRHSSHRMPA